jgi:hypothetical protein
MGFAQDFFAIFDGFYIFVLSRFMDLCAWDMVFGGCEEFFSSTVVDLPWCVDRPLIFFNGGNNDVSNKLAEGRIVLRNVDLVDGKADVGVTVDDMKYLPYMYNRIGFKYGFLGWNMYLKVKDEDLLHCVLKDHTTAQALMSMSLPQYVHNLPQSVEKNFGVHLKVVNGGVTRVPGFRLSDNPMEILSLLRSELVADRRNMSWYDYIMGGFWFSELKHWVVNRFFPRCLATMVYRRDFNNFVFYYKQLAAEMNPMFQFLHDIIYIKDNCGKTVVETMEDTLKSCSDLGDRKERENFRYDLYYKSYRVGCALDALATKSNFIEMKSEFDNLFVAASGPSEVSDMWKKSSYVASAEYNDFLQRTAYINFQTNKPWMKAIINDLKVANFSQFVENNGTVLMGFEQAGVNDNSVPLQLIEKAEGNMVLYKNFTLMSKDVYHMNNLTGFDVLDFYTKVAEQSTGVKECARIIFPDRVYHPYMDPRKIFMIDQQMNRALEVFTQALGKDKKLLDQSFRYSMYTSTYPFKQNLFPPIPQLRDFKLDFNFESANAKYSLLYNFAEVLFWEVFLRVAGDETLNEFQWIENLFDRRTNKLGPLMQGIRTLGYNYVSKFYQIVSDLRWITYHNAIIHNQYRAHLDLVEYPIFVLDKVSIDIPVGYMRMKRDIADNEPLYIFYHRGLPVMSIESDYMQPEMQWWNIRFEALMKNYVLDVCLNSQSTDVSAYYIPYSGDITRRNFVARSMLCDEHILEFMKNLSKGVYRKEELMHWNWNWAVGDEKNLFKYLISGGDNFILQRQSEICLNWRFSWSSYNKSWRLVM